MKSILIFAMAVCFSLQARTRIVVLDDAGKSCEPDEPERKVISLKSDELASRLKEYLEGKSQTGEKEFTHNIHFCSSKQRIDFLHTLVGELHTQPENPKLFVLMLQFSHLKPMLGQVEEQLAAKPTDEKYVAALEKAKKLIGYQRKHPDDHPTEKTLKLMEKKVGY